MRAAPSHASACRRPQRACRRRPSRHHRYARPSSRATSRTHRVSKPEPAFARADSTRVSRYVGALTWQAIRHELEAELGEPVSIDALTGAWRIAQREAGHRHSADDVLTAWFALREAPDVPVALAIGTGIV